MLFHVKDKFNQPRTLREVQIADYPVTLVDDFSELTLSPLSEIAMSLVLGVEKPVLEVRRIDHRKETRVYSGMLIGIGGPHDDLGPDDLPYILLPHGPMLPLAFEVNVSNDATEVVMESPLERQY